MFQCVAVRDAVLRNCHIFRRRHMFKCILWNTHTYSGQSYIFRCENADEWERDVDETREEAKEKRHDAMMQAKFGHSTLQMTRAKMKIGVNSLTWQYCVAAVIFVAFMVDVLEVCACVRNLARKYPLRFHQDLISIYVHMHKACISACTFLHTSYYYDSIHIYDVYNTCVQICVCFQAYQSARA